jgi:hypothetical protein
MTFSWNDRLVVQPAGYGGGSLVYANVQMRPPAELFRRVAVAVLAPGARSHHDLVASMLDVTRRSTQYRRTLAPCGLANV